MVKADFDFSAPEAVFGIFLYKATRRRWVIPVQRVSLYVTMTVLVVLLAGLLIVGLSVSGAAGATTSASYNWTLQKTGTVVSVNAVHAIDPGNVWAVFYDGNRWVDQSVPGPTDLFGVYALDTNHVWAVGTAGTILFYNGQDWSLQSGTNGREIICERPMYFDYRGAWSGGSDTLGYAP
jgi:hypothetical protein